MYMGTRERCAKQKQKVATRKIDPLAFLDEIARSFRISKMHCWKNDEKPTTLQSTIFVLKLIIFYAKNPKTPFTVLKSTFYNLKKHQCLSYEPSKNVC